MPTPNRDKPRAAVGTFPFAAHRTQAEVIEQKIRRELRGYLAMQKQRDNLSHNLSNPDHPHTTANSPVVHCGGAHAGQAGAAALVSSSLHASENAR